MTRSHDVELRILGPLEANVGDEQIPLGGAKQRAVLAVLLLRANEVVPVGRLIDEVWGDDPPPSAAHSLEAYVSRLRQLFNGHQPSLVRRGAGYSLELRGAVLDARVFVELLDAASLAADQGDPGRASQLGAEALALWRGPALADVSLASAGRAEADRLDELRLRTLELRFEAELARGRHEELVGELRVLVGQKTRIARASSRSSCSRSSARVGRPRPSTRTSKRADALTRISGSSRARSSNNCQARSCAKRLSSGYLPPSFARRSGEPSGRVRGACPGWC